MATRLSPERSAFPVAGTCPDAQAQPAQAFGRTADIIVVGSGPVGLFMARQLNGLACLHEERFCKNKDHKTYLRNHCPASCTPCIPKISAASKSLTGNWFSTFLPKNDGRPVPCLRFEERPDKQTDWLMISRSEVGGSWTTYTPEQLLVSPVQTTAMPDKPFPLENPEQQTSVSAQAFVRYLQDYARTRLPAERILTGYTLTNMKQEDDFWHLTTQAKTGETSTFRCKNVVMATGKTKENRLDISGEDEKIVSHNCRDARIQMSRLPEQSRVLIVGCGLSAGDALACALGKKHHITHIIRKTTVKQAKAQTNDSSSKILCSLSSYGYQTLLPELHTVARMVFFKDASGKNYTQLADARLISVSEDLGCILQKGRRARVECFDHVAILIGVQPDYSLIPLPDGDLCQRMKTLQLNEATMETCLPGLYVAGYYAKSSFVKYGYGHTVFINQDIRQKKLKRKRSDSSASDDMEKERAASARKTKLSTTKEGADSSAH